MSYIIAKQAKDIMLSALISSDYYTSGLSGTDGGLVEIILLERYRDAQDIPQEREYTDGSYGGMKEIEWDKVIEAGETYAETIKQKSDITFDVGAGIDIVGFRLYFFDGTTIEIGITHRFDGTIFNFPDDGFLTMSSIEIGIGRRGL